MYNQSSEYETASTPDNWPMEGQQKNLHHPNEFGERRNKKKKRKFNAHNQNTSDQIGSEERYSQNESYADLRFTLPYAINTNTFYMKEYRSF